MKICKRMFMDATDLFSDEAGDLMEEVYQHNTKCHPLGCTEGEREA